MALQGVWPALTSFQWSASASPLVLAIATRQRQHAVQLVSCAYSSIQPARLAALTGSTPEEALQSKHAFLAMYTSDVCQKVQWHIKVIQLSAKGVCMHVQLLSHKGGSYMEKSYW